MWNNNYNRRENNGDQTGEGREGLVAVAIDKDKSSKSALRWAVEHYIPRGTTIKLVHVNQKSPSNHNPAYPAPAGNDENGLAGRQPDNQTTEMLLPLRCFCVRRQIQSETVILEDQDVAKALIKYVYQNCIGTLLLGATTKSSFTRLFKGAYIPSSVMRWAPDFCNVLIISKGRVASVRSASRPVPAAMSTPGDGGAPLLPYNVNNEEPSIMLLSREDDVLYDELSAYDPDISFANSGRPSTDSTFLSFYENLWSRRTRDSLKRSNAGGGHYETLHCRSAPPVDLSTLPYLSAIMEDTGRRSSSLKNIDMDDEMRRLKIELKQSMEMYHVACKEALAAKQKAMELEKWKKKEEKSLAEETSMATVEREKAKCTEATDTAEAAQKIMELEVQKRVEAELKALREAEERKKMLDALGQSHFVLKYQSLFHILVVLFLFYFYFSVFN